MFIIKCTYYNFRNVSCAHSYHIGFLRLKSLLESLLHFLPEMHQHSQKESKYNMLGFFFLFGWVFFSCLSFLWGFCHWWLFVCLLFPADYRNQAFTYVTISHFSLCFVKTNWSCFSHCLWHLSSPCHYHGICLTISSFPAYLEAQLPATLKYVLHQV